MSTDPRPHKVGCTIYPKDHDGFCPTDPVSTETRDALREALAEAMATVARAPNPVNANIGDPWQRFAADALAHPAMVAALRATDAPVAEGLRKAVIAAEWMDPTPEAGSGRCPACHVYRANGTGHSPYCWFAPVAALATPEPDA